MELKSHDCEIIGAIRRAAERGITARGMLVAFDDGPEEGAAPGGGRRSDAAFLRLMGRFVEWARDDLRTLSRDIDRRSKTARSSMS